MIQNMDDILIQVGEFGRFQILMQTIYSLIKLPHRFQALITYFATLPSTWVCLTSEGVCDKNATYAADNTLRCTLPRNAWSHTESSDFSIVTQFDLVCGKEWLVHLASSMTFVGWAFGSVVFGWLADNFGRRHVLFSSYFVMILVSLMSIFSPSVVVFIVSRGIVGICMGGTFLMLMVMATELVGPKYRPVTVITLTIVNAFGTCSLSLAANFIRDWRLLFMCCTLPFLPVVLFWKFVPESCRWLVSKQKTQEYKSVVKKMARMNKKQFKWSESFNLIKAPNTRKSSYLELVQDRNILLKTLSQGYAWFAVVLVYFGLFLASSDLGVGSVYVNFILIAIVDLPGSFLAMYVCKNIGRKTAVVYSMLAGGLCCLAVAFLPRSGDMGVLRLVVGLLGKFCISLSFDSFYTWSLELYPTHIRAVSSGYLQVNARIGGAAAPWIAQGLKEFHKDAPFVTMAALALTAGAILLRLPETRGKDIDQRSQESLIKPDFNNNEGHVVLSDSLIYSQYISCV